MSILFLFYCLYKVDFLSDKKTTVISTNSQINTSQNSDEYDLTQGYENTGYDLEQKVLPFEKDTVIKNCKTIMFDGSPINKDNSILRWKDNIKVKITGQYGDKEKEIVNNLISKLNLIENFPTIKLVDKGESANFIVAFGSNSYLASHYINIPNYGFKYRCILSGTDKYINHAYLRIAKLNDYILYNKRITRAFLEAFGIGKSDSEIYNISETVFNPNVRTYYISSFDRMLIEVLYSKEFKPGKYSDKMKNVVEDYLNKNYDFIVPTTVQTTEVIMGEPPIY